MRLVIASRRGGVAHLLAIALAVVALPARAATVPAGFTETLLGSGLSSPTTMQIAPDGRVFVAEQGGRLRVIKNGVLLATPFATLAVDAAGERGLLGVAFDPNFTINRYVYVYYTAAEPIVRNRISRLTANGDVAVPGSEVVLLQTEVRSAQNHLGGAIDFGPDGRLFAAVGDNSSPANAQSLASLHGKILRINTDGSIPTDNPFYAMTSGLNRAIWALGLRNPFTFAINASKTRMFINDVGQQTWEEIDDGVRGANYGWPETEGPTNDPRFRGPIRAYDHSDGSCAITGGAFYTPTAIQFPSAYLNDYFFADYCGGWIRKLDSAGNTVETFATGILAPVDLKVDAGGSLYYLARGLGVATGVVYRIDYSGSPAPLITLHPTNQSVAPGASVTFSVRASGTPPLSYQWRRNGVNISGATAQDYTIASAGSADDGDWFRALVTNSYGSVLSNEAVLTVGTNQSPIGTITQPVAGALYSGGSSITVAATGVDPEDGTLPASAFTWQVDFHHDTHTHPLVPPTNGITSGSFTIPTTGETSAHVWYRVHLTVVDSGGLAHATYRDVLPRTVRLTLATSPAGLQVRLDGQPVTTPHAFDGVVGITRTIEAITPQTSSGTTYQFASWSNGGAVGHTISTPTANTTYTATYSGGAGTGLSATYYDNPDFTGSAVSRVDPAVNFDWSASPAPGIAADTFSVRWSGQVRPQFTQTYTFYTQSNDGVRLWVNGQLLIDNWTAHALTTNTGTIALVAGQLYAIRMEFFDNTGVATARLGWSSPSTPLAVIPTARLFP